MSGRRVLRCGRVLYAPLNIRFVKNTFTDLQESTVGTLIHQFYNSPGAVYLQHEIMVGDKKVKFDI